MYYFYVHVYGNLHLDTSIYPYNNLFSIFYLTGEVIGVSTMKAIGDESNRFLFLSFLMHTQVKIHLNTFIHLYRYNNLFRVCCFTGGL